MEYDTPIYVPLDTESRHGRVYATYRRLAGDGKVTLAAAAEALGMTRAGVLHHVRRLERLGLIERDGAGYRLAQLRRRRVLVADEPATQETD